ncbi:hypothetical protein WJX72_001114 [[Myrmecia] bisecta]|uniref:SigF-like NTF2-like domain-containing protein n=1 Tax=[Myrmecia] bisecta TaxID=41462 RepID=A0AAW1PNZ7_9CHLO
MQNLDKDLDQTIETLLRGDYASLKLVVKRCFTEDAVFDHPFLVATGRNQIFEVYRYWNSVCTKDLRFRINQRVISASGDQVALHLSEWITPHFYPSALLPSPVLHLIIILQFVDTPRGKVICRQEDHPLWLESLVYQIPVIGPLYKQGWRRFVGAAIVKATPFLDHVLGEVQDATKSTRSNAKLQQ